MDNLTSPKIFVQTLCFSAVMSSKNMNNYLYWNFHFIRHSTQEIEFYSFIYLLDLGLTVISILLRVILPVDLNLELFMIPASYS